jgi:hypothetical protein
MQVQAAYPGACLAREGMVINLGGSEPDLSAHLPTDLPNALELLSRK